MVVFALHLNAWNAWSVWGVLYTGWMNRFIKGNSAFAALLCIYELLSHLYSRLLPLLALADGYSFLAGGESEWISNTHSLNRIENACNREHPIWQDTYETLRDLFLFFFFDGILWFGG